MSTKFKFELEVEPRETFGKGASRRLRRLEERVPGIVYGGESSPLPIHITQRSILKALENEAIFSHILTLNVAGKKEKVVLKDIQRHPYKPRILHLDFLRIDENKLITMHVPLHFPGQEKAPGVVEGGMVTHHMVELEIRCLPKNLPEFIEIDLTNAKLDTVVHLSQVTLPKGVEMTSVVHSAEDDLPVVSIHRPKVVVEDEAVAEEAPVADAKKGSEAGNTGNNAKE